MKRALSILAILVVCAALFLPLPAACAENSYAVDYADMDIVLNSDGSASVTETWKITSYGSSSCFYKDICTDLPIAEEFTSLTDLSVFIDGTPCEPTPDTEQVSDYHYDRTDGKKAVTLTAYLQTGFGTHVYTFSYRLTDMVKRVDGDHALFCFRPVSAKFSPIVNNLIIRVTPPSDCTMTDLSHTSGSFEVSYGTAVYHTIGHEGLFRLRLRMDGADFGQLRNISLRESRRELTPGGIRIIWTVCVILFLCILMILSLLFKAGPFHRIRLALKSRRSGKT